MKPEELMLTARVEEINPTDRVRGTVVNIDSSGLFVVHYDNGDYLAYMPEQIEGFKAIPEKPIPRAAAGMIRELNRIHGRVPPQDVAKMRGIPGQSTTTPRIGDNSTNPTLTRQANPPSI
jgi:hypothetical protein